MRKTSRGQSSAEYAVILSLVVAAVIGMQVYVKRGLQARVKAGTDALTSVGADFSIAAPDGATDLNAVTFSALRQYEPYYQESQYTSYSENVEQEHMGDGQISKEKVSDISVREAGGYQAQIGTKDATDRDAEWEDQFGSSGSSATTP